MNLLETLTVGLLDGVELVSETFHVRHNQGSTLKVMFVISVILQLQCVAVLSLKLLQLYSEIIS